MPEVPRASRHALAISALATLALGFAAAAPPAPARVQTTLVAAGPWLDRLNQWRTSTGLSALTEDTTWSAGDYNHAVYMVKNNLVTHYETSGTPYYTTAGDTAARNGNIQVSSRTSTTDPQVIDWWMAAPFHAMAMMDPRLSITGFGSYRDTTTSPWQEGAALDTLRGNSFSGGAYPVYFPGNGASEPLNAYNGGEFPDPLQACPGYSAPTGLPVFIEVGGNVNTTAGPVHSFTGNGVGLAHCVIDSSNAAVGSYLYARGGVIVVPQQPLQSGVKYVVALTVNGVPYTWSFTVGPFLASVAVVSPNAGPIAGGTAVTISGAGFANALTAVKFGATAATSFTVVNDSTLTAVSPAHTAGTVDVTVTTSSGTSSPSSLDHFTYGACTTVTAAATPPSQASPGATVTFTAAAAGCASPLYEFWTLAPGSSSWAVAQAYSTSSTFSWNTAGLPTGVYRYSVWTRDAAGTGATCGGLGCYDAFVPGTAYTLATTACTSSSASIAPAPPQPSGTAVTITASASGCPNPRYEFWTMAPGGSWTIAQGYSMGNAFNWATTGLAAGTYKYSVWVRDAGSSAAYDTFVPGAPYALTAARCASPNGGVSPASPQGAGTAITISASSSACSNPLYEFWIQAPGGSWTITQPYSSSNTFTWTTAGLPAGIYRYSVWVRDAASPASYDTYLPGTAYALTTVPCAGVTVTASPASPQAAGTTVTISANASGCPNPRFEFWTMAPGGAWTIVQGYSSNATFTWNTVGKAAGTYRYSVWARDASSSAAYDTYFPGTAYTLS